MKQKISELSDEEITDLVRAGDIEIGKRIIVTGQENSDGSYTAGTLQLSPVDF